jgi:hypothetical protein
MMIIRFQKTALPKSTGVQHTVGTAKMATKCANCVDLVSSKKPLGAVQISSLYSSET